MTNSDDFGCMSYKVRNDKILHRSTVIVLQSLFKTKPHEVTLIDPEAKSFGQAEENALSCTLYKIGFLDAEIWILLFFYVMQRGN